MHTVEHERLDDEHPIKSFSLDEVRKAAAELAKPNAREHVRCPPIAKPYYARTAADIMADDTKYAQLRGMATL